MGRPGKKRGKQTREGEQIGTSYSFFFFPLLLNRPVKPRNARRITRRAQEKRKDGHFDKKAPRRVRKCHPRRTDVIGRERALSDRDDARFVLAAFRARRGLETADDPPRKYFQRRQGGRQGGRKQGGARARARAARDFHADTGVGSRGGIILLRQIESRTPSLHPPPTGVNPLRGESRGRTRTLVTAWVKRSYAREERGREKERDRERARERESG